MKKPLSLSLSLSLCLYLLWAIASICLFFYFSGKCIREYFGDVTVSQLLVHLNLGTASAHIFEDMLESIVKYAAFFFASSGALLYLTYDTTKEKHIFSIVHNALKKAYYIIIAISKSRSAKAVLLCAALLISVSVYVFCRFDKRLHVVDYLTQEDSLLFSDNYYKLDVNNISSSNKNLLLLFIESFEDGYSDASVYEANLIQGLSDLKSEGISFSNYVKTSGAYYSMDGICAQFCGVPLLHLPFRSNKYRNFFSKQLLKNTPSLFNLLKNMQYETVSFLAESRNFTQKGTFFEVHGIDTVLSKEYWNKKGFGRNVANKNPVWGFNDEFLFNRVKKYLAHRTSDKKFAIFVETVDSHDPGFVTEKDRRFNDMRDAFIRVSRLTTEFIEWAKKQEWYKDTVIVIVGDHPWQDGRKNPLKQFIQKSQNRQIFNLILNSDAQPVRGITGWSSIDMAPTILHAMGISFTSHNVSGNISHNKIGIGTSLFSNETTLVEKYHGDGEAIAEELAKPNKFYDSLL